MSDLEAALMDHLYANQYDGQRGGRTTASIDMLVSDTAEIVIEFLSDPANAPLLLAIPVVKALVDETERSVDRCGCQTCRRVDDTLAPFTKGAPMPSELTGRDRPADQGRWRMQRHFGATFASNSTSVCNDCGAVVYDEKVHNVWHSQFTYEPTDA